MIRRLVLLAPVIASACSSPVAPPVSASPTLAAATASPPSAPSASGSVRPSASAGAPASAIGSAVPTPSATTAASGPFAGYIFVSNATGAPPDGFTRYGATLVDGKSGDPLVGACVYTGPPAGCPPKGAIETGDDGTFAIDLPSGSEWAFTFEYPGYTPLLTARLEPGTTNSITLIHP
ncbi:MAG: hypothetical protein KGK34_02645 [Chloroflexota bacterium]|nr:hypothetical protein [Chloroflexota bacterium]